MLLTEAHFVESMLDVEIGDSRPGKGQPLNGNVDINFLGFLRGCYILLNVKGDIVQHSLPVEGLDLGNYSSI